MWLVCDWDEFIIPHMVKSHVITFKFTFDPAHSNDKINIHLLLYLDHYDRAHMVCISSKQGKLLCELVENIVTMTISSADHVSSIIVIQIQLQFTFGFGLIGRDCVCNSVDSVDNLKGLKISKFINTLHVCQ